MAQTSRNSAVSGAAKTSAKEMISLSSGKENVCPSLNVAGGRKVSFASAGTACQTRISLGSIDQRRNAFETGVANARGGRAFGQTYPGKKTAFHVHCDERNVAPSQNTRDGSDRGATDTRSDVKEAKAETSRKRSASGGKWTIVEPQDGKKPQPPSKIPRRSRSNSVPAKQNQPRIGTRGRLASIEFPIRSRYSRILNNERVVGNRTTLRTAGISHPASTGVVKTGEKLERIFKARKQRRGESTATPIDGAPPPPEPAIRIKAVIRQSKSKAVEPSETDRGVQVPSCSKDRDPFPAALAYHTEYLEDLPIVEREREKLSPVLSRNFLLERHINAEQRRLVVVFMLHLGTHCRYPSYIVYQSVKLFDLVMDRIRVETALIQLTALASLWIALKKQENFHKVPTAKSMVALANELYAGREDLLIKYERKILQALNFKVTFADAFTLYTHHLINCIRFVDMSDETTTFLYNTGCYLIDVTLLDELFCRTPASLIALTAAELALGLVLDVATTAQTRPRWLFWRGLLFAATSHLPDRFGDKEIDWARITMLRRLLNSGKKHSGFDVVYKKYSRSRHGRISESLLERAGRVSLTETFYDP
ncbi:G2/mitotic-specific cyclin cig1 [Anthophora retusa]